MVARGRRSRGSISRRTGGEFASENSPARRYPRAARVNRLLTEVVAEELSRLADVDERLRLVTVTGVDADPDLRHATVWVGSLGEEAATALGEARIRLQAAIGRQVRLKRTPALAFRPDPAVSAGARIEEILRGLTTPGEEPPEGEGPRD